MKRKNMTKAKFKAICYDVNKDDCIFMVEKEGFSFSLRDKYWYMNFDKSDKSWKIIEGYTGHVFAFGNTKTDAILSLDFGLSVFMKSENFWNEYQDKVSDIKKAGIRLPVNANFKPLIRRA